MTIEVTDSYTVEAGENVRGHKTLFLLAGEFPALTNHGLMLIISAAAGEELVMIEASATHPDVTNEADGVMRLAARGEGEAVYGLRFEGEGSFTNLGEVFVSSAAGDATAVAGGGGAFIDNRDALKVVGETGATGVRIAGLSTFLNEASGSISVKAAAHALGVQVGAGADFRNHGLIEVSSASGAVGVRLDGPVNVALNEGDGMIVAEGAGGIGLLLSGADAGEWQETFENNGVIRGATAVAVDPLGDRLHLTLDNNGKIFGDINLGRSDDRIENAGRIDGAVDLGDGQDFYFNLTGGSQTGPVYGGGGRDGLQGGKGADLLYGDGAAVGDRDSWDTLNGGKGSDTLSGGGAADQFLYRSVSDSTAAARDLILDLEGHDVISLTMVDADATLSGRQHFHLVDAFTGQAGELTISYDADRDLTLIEGDVDGDGQGDLCDQRHGRPQHLPPLPLLTRRPTEVGWVGATRKSGLSPPWPPPRFVSYKTRGACVRHKGLTS